MSKDKKLAEQREENRVKLAQIQATTERFKVVASAVTKVGVGACFAAGVYFLAGQETVFKAVLEGVFKADMSEWAYRSLQILVGGGFGLGWLRERRLRHKEVSSLSADNKRLELLIDPKRSSSGLSPRGLPAASDEKLVGSGKSVDLKKLPPGEE